MRSRYAPCKPQPAAPNRRNPPTPAGPAEAPLAELVEAPLAGPVEARVFESSDGLQATAFDRLRLRVFVDRACRSPVG